MRAGILCVVFLALSGCFEASGQPSRAQAAGTSVQTAQLAAQRAQDAAQAAIKAKADAEAAKADAEAAMKRLDTVSADIVSRVTFVGTTASGLITYVQFAIGIGTLLAVIAAVVTGLTLRESRKKILQEVKSATDAAAQIAELRDRASQHRFFLDTLQLQVNGALAKIVTTMETPASTPGTALIGVDLGSAVPQRWYDDDALVVFADRLGIMPEDLTPAQRAEFLVKFGNYWRRTKEYGRAIERIRRAVELDPSSALAHKALGRAFWNKVGESLPASGVATSPEQLELLRQAETALETAKGLLAARNERYEDILYDLGTISRYRVQASEAITWYQQGARLSKALAQTENRDPDWDFDYAIGCLYARTNQFQQALDKMKEIVDKTQTWDQERRRVEVRNYREWMRTDPDFEGMMADAAWKARLEAL